MNIVLPEEIQHHILYKISMNHTARTLGSGTVEVLATPSMILFMEQVAMNSVIPFLPEGYGTVGTRICVDHLKAVGIGEEVEVFAKLLSQDRKKLEFEVTARYQGYVIGSGTHTRFIVNENEFMSRLQ